MIQTKLTQSIYTSNLKSRAVLVMNYLIFRSNKEKTCFPAIKTIAKEVHVSVNTVKRALDDLVAAGFVKKEARFIKEKNGAQTSNLFKLCEVVIEGRVCEQIVEEPEVVDEDLEEQSIEFEVFEVLSNNDNCEAIEQSEEKGTIKENNKEKTYQWVLKWWIHVADWQKKVSFSDTHSNKWATPQPIMIPP